MLWCLSDWSSALIYITDGETDEHLEMLEGGVVKQLLDEKWKTFARVGSLFHYCQFHWSNIPHFTNYF
jgi:hypothetical protein